MNGAGAHRNSAVAVIGGTGAEGFGLASRWVRRGIDVIVGSRDVKRAEEAAARLREIAQGAEVHGLINEEAAAAAGKVVVTVPFSGQAAIYKSIAESLSADAVVVDCTVPLATTVGGRASRVLGVWEGSAAQQASALLKADQKVCGAFHSMSAPAMRDLDARLEGDVLVCGPREGKSAVRELVEAIPDLRFVDAGPLENARIIEPLTALLIGINRRYKTNHSGIRITGLPD
ncbi:MAG: NADPH-dependent F420 reductase [Actinobacteria bacterium]|nr:NADPH-dependent F420 reductase [Actinomycetota bacterium]